MGHREALATVLKGAAMGTADLVPGVSGGTIALVAGIYDRLVAAVASLDPRALRLVAGAHRAEGRAALADAWRRMDLTFLALLGTGMASAVVVLSQLVPIALEEARGPTGAFFAGLIVASVVLIGRQVPWTAPRAGVAAVAALVVLGVAWTTGGSTEPSLVGVFVAGAVAISAMVLPGLSGALLLLVLGVYEYLLDELGAFVDGLAALALGGSTAPVLEHGPVVATFVGGAVVGLLTVARAVDWALERDRATTIAGLVGLMAGGVYPPAELAAEGAGFGAFDGEPTLATAAGLLVAALVGAAVVAGFDRATDDLEYVEREAPDTGAGSPEPVGESDPSVRK